MTVIDARACPPLATHAVRQMAAIVLRDEPDGVWRCHYCRVEVIQFDRPWIDTGGPYPERDHVVPRARGGSNAISNLALACGGCNVRKGSKLLDELPLDWQEWRNAPCRPSAVLAGGPF